MPTDDSKSSDSFDRESLQALSQALQQHFPHHREETELVLLAVSPHRLHAYWHITPTDLDAMLARARPSHARLVIRFHDLSDPNAEHSHHPWFDLELTETSGNRYVELWQDAKRYTGELGLRTAAGELLVMASSNRVELPRAEPSPLAGSQVLTLTPQAEAFYQGPSDRQQATVQRQAWQENPDQPIDYTLVDRGLVLEPEFPDPLRVPASVQRLRLPAYPQFQAIEISPQTATARLTEQPATAMPLPGALDSAQPPRLEKTFPLSPVQTLNWTEMATTRAGAVSLPIAPSGQPAAASPLPPWPDELPVYRPAAAAAGPTLTTATSFPGSPPQPVSSQELAHPEGVAADMELHMELHIRGRKHPNGQFVLFGLPIPTDPQGRFTLIRHLPPETQQLVAQLLAASRED